MAQLLMKAKIQVHEGDEIFLPGQTFIVDDERGDYLDDIGAASIEEVVKEKQKAPAKPPKVEDRPKTETPAAEPVVEESDK